jgi:divinyl chlorophyllide a 8-vinyl-reductase
MTPKPKRIFMLGATGTIGRATHAALIARGHEVVCFVRAQGAAQNVLGPDAILHLGDVTDPKSLEQDGFRGQRFDAIVSCLASRTGTTQSAWAIDHQAHLHSLRLGKQAGIEQFVLLSAICVQKPLLAFQQAKLAFEGELINSGVTYSIVRPTAFFKSLSGQVERLKQGKPFLIFGDGTKTACKPISDADLAQFLARCLNEAALQNAILPIGGPGPALTPMDQGKALFKLLNKPEKYRSVPIGFMDGIIAALGGLSLIVPRLKDKAELAKIGRYYATESMLVLNPQTGQYDAAATPSTGHDHLFDHYARLIKGEISADLGDHAVF